LFVSVVTFKLGGIGLLVPGAKMLLTAQLRDGRPVAMRVLAGRNRFVPPMLEAGQSDIASDVRRRSRFRGRH
jgi:hypothetical protein